AGVLPVVLDEADVVFLGLDPDRPQRAEIDVLDVRRARLQDHLVLVELLEPERVLAVAAVIGTDRRLDVGGAPRLWPEHAQERGWVRGAGADLGVVRLEDRAALGLPVGLERRDHPLERGRRHRWA